MSKVTSFIIGLLLAVLLLSALLNIHFIQVIQDYETYYKIDMTNISMEVEALQHQEK